jgi:hypothetical protein
MIGGGIGAAANSCGVRVNGYYYNGYYGYPSYEHWRYGPGYVAPPPPPPYAAGPYPAPISYPVGPGAYPTPPAPVYRGYYTGYGPPPIDCWPDDSC